MSMGAKCEKTVLSIFSPGEQVLKQKKFLKRFLAESSDFNNLRLKFKKADFFLNNMPGVALNLLVKLCICTM